MDDSFDLSLLRAQFEENRKRKRNHDTHITEHVEDDGDDWYPEQHRAFVTAVFDEGMKHASPSVIMESMKDTELITSERVKSHLQKFRKRKEKSKADFMDEYDRCLTKFMAESGPKSETKNGPAVHSGGAAAIARVTQALLAKSGVCGASARLLKRATHSSIKPQHFLNRLEKKHHVLELSLTDEERQTPLGIALSHVMAMVQPMGQMLFREREREMMKRKGTGSVTASNQNCQSFLPSAQRKPAPQMNTRAPSSPRPARIIWEDSFDSRTFFEVQQDEAESIVFRGDVYHSSRPVKSDQAQQRNPGHDDLIPL